MRPSRRGPLRQSEVGVKLVGSKPKRFQDGDQVRACVRACVCACSVASLGATADLRQLLKRGHGRRVLLRALRHVGRCDGGASRAHGRARVERYTRVEHVWNAWNVLRRTVNFELIRLIFPAALYRPSYERVWRPRSASVVPGQCGDDRCIGGIAAKSLFFDAVRKPRILT